MSRMKPVPDQSKSMTGVKFQEKPALQCRTTMQRTLIPDTTGSDPMARHGDSHFRAALSADILLAAFVAMRGFHTEATSPCRDPHARTMRAHGSTP